MLASTSINSALVIVLSRLRAKKRANPKAGPSLTLGGARNEKLLLEAITNTKNY